MVEVALRGEGDTGTTDLDDDDEESTLEKEMIADAQGDETTFVYLEA